MAKIHIYDCDAVYGFVNYGSMDSEDNGGYATKMRCKKCGAAWLDINHVSGYDTCPKCGAQGDKYIMAVN